MSYTDFEHYLSRVTNLSDKQFISLKGKVNHMSYTDFVSVSIDQSSSINSCKYCDSSDLYKWGRRCGLQRYKCKICSRTFNTLTNTPLANLRKKHKWIKYALCLKRGLSLIKSAEECGIHKNTSFRWRHRFLNNTTSIKALNLFGIVEMSSVTMYKSYKGCKDIPRIARPRGLNILQKRMSCEKFPVFFCRGRSTYIYDKIFEEFSKKEISFSLDGIMFNDTLLFSKRNSIYKNFTKSKLIQHSIIKKRRDILKNNIVHINNVRKYYSRLLKWMKRFNGVATKYLANYLSWYRFLDEFDMNIKPESIVLRACFGGDYKKERVFYNEY